MHRTYEVYFRKIIGFLSSAIGIPLAISNSAGRSKTTKALSDKRAVSAISPDQPENRKVVKVVRRLSGRKTRKAKKGFPAAMLGMEAGRSVMAIRGAAHLRIRV